MNNKSDLLKQLTIEREPANQATPEGLSALKLIMLLACGALLGAAILWFLMPPSMAEKQSASAPVKPVAKTDMSAPVTQNQSFENDAVLNASGYITARRMATVSAEIMGLITDVRVEEGMTVEQGQILATLDDAIARSNLDFARAQIDVLTARKESAEANLAEAKLNLKRVTENGYSSEADITRSTTDVKNQSASLKGLEADIKVARIEVQRQQERFDDHTIRAPFAGVVIGKNAQPGEIVAPSSAGGGFTRTGICTIVDMDSLEIEVDVNESFIGRVQPGQKVEATLEAYPDWKIPATVIAIIPTADRAKATVRVRIGIDQKDSRILPDMGVKVAFLKE